MRIDSDPHTLYRDLEGIRGERPRAEAVVRTTRAGFSLGGFGVEYESEEVHVDESLSPGARAARRLTREFETESSVRTLRSEVAEEAVNSRVNWAASLPNRPSHTARHGLDAYSRAMQPESPLPGGNLAAIA
ncbi:hypothetical protein [Salidesulfovibrio brasiliensis]|uniref:hypothetical protein n=1 Tax=Salidesulfovibrio brasiliensis TaxID=221711 RepID=UPI0006CF42B5|nr:hypothetical protein [Salidesulfovibrio brasiliensis]